MSNHDWPPSNESKQEVTKLLNQETIQDISDRIVGDKKLEAILYDVYGSGRPLENDKDGINQSVNSFFIRYPDLKSFKHGGRPYVPAEELLMKYPDIKEAMKAFKTIMYGKNGEISYVKAPQADQEAITQENLTAPEFKQEGAKPVEFIRSSIKICDDILSDEEHKDQLKYILAEFTEFKFGREGINLDTINQLVNQFMSEYKTLEDFEINGNVENFLDQLAFQGKKGKYQKAIMRFEDVMFGNHKER